MADPHEAMKNKQAAAMGSFGKMASLKDLPSDKILKALIKEAVHLNEEGIKLPSTARKNPVPGAAIVEPEYVTKALNKNDAAKKSMGSLCALAPPRIS